ncbi:MAG TPA: HemK/PrmC family methyltransferase [Candidatus Saccharimonadales bacterium]|nr:HemK/PrmC family methyltransferase [Candidatus Saccharimonadales bacterium]
MTVNEWLATAKNNLDAAGIPTARLDSLILLEDTTAIDRVQLLANPNLVLKPNIVKKLNLLLNQRSKYEPLAYIRGKSEFYGRSFKINKNVLQPRPESEAMIDLLKTLCNKLFPYNNAKIGRNNANNNLWLADVGSGSGILGITAKLEVPDLSVDLLEIDIKALKLAKFNVDIYTPNIGLILSDLLHSTSREYDILLANLPYVPDDYTINKSAEYEPEIALFGGQDGLDVYRKLFKQIERLNKRPLYILTESMPFQHLKLTNIARKYKYKLASNVDYIQEFRAI